MKDMVATHSDSIPLATACRALGLNRSTVYDWKNPEKIKDPGSRSRKNCVQPRALGEPEKREILTLLHSETYHDQPPAQVYYELLAQGEYLCSISSMHRLLRTVNGQGERRLQRPAQHNAIPRLRATKPDDVWTWDITKIRTHHKGEYLSLYVVLDLYSRFVVAWMLSRKENSALASQLMEEATSRYNIGRGELTIHQDRGSPMIAQGYLDLMGEFGVTCSHSRPRVSNDNAFSESQFRTMKYQPDYPGRFENIASARDWCESYFDWYNFSHHHSGLSGYTPEQVFTGRHKEVEKKRSEALDAAYKANPERFVLGRPNAGVVPEVVEINPVVLDNNELDPPSTCVNFPTLKAAGAKKNTLTLD